MPRPTRPTFHKPLVASARSSKQANDLRHDMSLPEVLLWRHLKSHQLAGLRFRRQHPLGPYIADFYCHDHAMVVEIDGSDHRGDRFMRDVARDKWMADRGLRVLRVRAVDVLKDINGVLEAIEREAGRIGGERSGTGPPPSASPPPPPSATGEDSEADAAAP